MRTFQDALSYRAITAGTILLVSIGLVAYSVQALWRDRQVKQGAVAAIPAETIVYTTAEPDETLPDCASYQAAGNEPRKIEISSVGIDGCIQKVGIDQNNAIAAPSNVHLGGWFTNTVLPGQTGISLIDGHVQGRYGTAIFANLDRVKPGDEIRVQLGNGVWRSFEAVDTKSHPANTVMDHLFDPLGDTESQLTLITCTGTYDKQVQEYTNRLVVRAKLVL